MNSSESASIVEEEESLAIDDRVSPIRARYRNSNSQSHYSSSDNSDYSSGSSGELGHGDDDRRDLTTIAMPGGRAGHGATPGANPRAISAISAVTAIDDEPYTFSQRLFKIFPRLLCVLVVLAQGVALDGFLAEDFNDDRMFALIIADVIVVAVIGVTMATNYRVITAVRGQSVRESFVSLKSQAPPTHLPSPNLPSTRLTQSLPCVAWLFYSVLLVLKIVLLVYHPVSPWVIDGSGGGVLPPSRSNATASNATRVNVNVSSPVNLDEVLRIAGGVVDSLDGNRTSGGADERAEESAVRRWIRERWRHESSEEVESVLKVVVALAAVVFLLMILTLQTVDATNTSRKMFLEFAASRVTFDVLDCVQLLSVTLFADAALVGGEDAADAGDAAGLTTAQMALRNAIVVFASLSLVTPAVAIADLSFSLHGLLPSKPYIRLASSLLHLFLINVPFFVIRLVLSLSRASKGGAAAWSGDVATAPADAVSVFMVKNVVMIFLGVRNVRKVQRHILKLRAAEAAAAARESGVA